jgi:hypothetical protein
MFGKQVASEESRNQTEAPAPDPARPQEKARLARDLKNRERTRASKGRPVLRLNCKPFHLFCNTPHRSSLQSQMTNKFARSTHFCSFFFFVSEK